MNPIAFIDTEIDPKSGKILDIGAIRDNGGEFHGTSPQEFTAFLDGVRFVCGHNVLNHDLKFVARCVARAGISEEHVIDTLYLSPLLFPTKPYHKLLKDDKLQTEELNNPFNDARKAKDLFYDEVTAFNATDLAIKRIFRLLLKDQKEFRGFFRFIAFECGTIEPENIIRQTFQNEICEHVDLARFITENPVELAYSLSLIHSFIQNQNLYSITPPWVLRNYPKVEQIMFSMRNLPCIKGCTYCNRALDIHQGLKSFFGFDHFRTYAGEPLQEKAIAAAVFNKSLLAVFPTGGGKSLTFQLPGLMSGENYGGLTIVISPLQSLMKDQVDNLEKADITQAVTINGLLDPIERAKSIARVEDGSATMLYISPESLRSRTIQKLILGRKIDRFVIDEAHCFSAWGQDFRVDYLYIGDFIKSVQAKKNLDDGIPVSCFTATAKQKVIEDIQGYFREKLNLELELFTSKASRTNLHYQVFKKGDDEDKYLAVRDLLETKKCPTIIYVSRTRKAIVLAQRLSEDGFNAKPYHGKMESKEKTENQNDFISGSVQIIVATSAFGMGVDKKDVGMVIHYQISDSLENYVQEAGRAGRDQTLSADCYILFNEEDLSKHFILLNQTKISIKEIQQIWRAIKELTRFRLKVSNSALEIARKAGWDDSVNEMEIRVKTAIAALENAGYLKRGQNMPRIFANSILSKNAQEAIDKINASPKFRENQKITATRIIKMLFSSKSRKQSNEETPESRIDYIGDHLGIVKTEVINVVNLLREENILADNKDLTAFIKRSENVNRSLQIVSTFGKIEQFLLTILKEEEKKYNIKELNEQAEADGCDGINIHKLKTIINFWAIKHWIKRKNLPYTKNYLSIHCLSHNEILKEKLEKRHTIATFAVNYLYRKSSQDADDGEQEVLVEFSVHELKNAFEYQSVLFEIEVSIDDIEDALFYLSRIGAIKIEGGFLVVYNRLTIERTEQDNRKQYKIEDYESLRQFYENKILQIHIVGEYAKKMAADYTDALLFVDDYFQLNYSSFLRKYFKGTRENEIKRGLTPAKFRELFGTLSATQLNIINDNETKQILVAAGPGSGKTRVLVHKLASLLMMEDVKHEQLLMLTFSRAAATQFKKRLLKLIGNAANFVEIKTFHAYCFDLLGKVGSLEKSDEILRKTVALIEKGEVEPNRIIKTVLVIDEAQDMNQDEFNLVKSLMARNDEIRVIAVGDDDQNIFEFRGANSNYMRDLVGKEHSKIHELLENFRSKNNLVEFANQFAQNIPKRLKSAPNIAVQRDNGAIKLVHYHGRNLTVPLVRDILESNLSGAIGVLTKTNDEALQVTGLLIKHGVKAKLIQSNDGFNLYNLLEVRCFLNFLNLTDDDFTIQNEVWKEAKHQLKTRFSAGSNLEIALNLIKDFEKTNPKLKYKSDLDAFIRDSRLEDFIVEKGETILVSTIHKSKGREFDHVFLLLANFTPHSAEDFRQIYVALTRAKQRLNIHTNSNLLQHISVEGLERSNRNEAFMPPNELVMQLTYQDIWLDHTARKQYQVAQLSSGDKLTIHNGECLTAKGQSVLKFSQHFKNHIQKLRTQNYRLTSAKVNFILYWKKEGEDPEVKIILPEVHFVKEDRTRK